MNKRKTNGEGSIYKVIHKVKRKKFLKKICSICNLCSNKCDRKNFEKCDKCINCKKICIKECDRFYCSEKWIAQITVNNKQITVATAKTQKEAVAKKRISEAKLLTNTYIERNSVGILELIKKVDNDKLKSGNIKQSTYNRNLYQYNKIEKSELGDIPIQKITYQQVQDFLNLQRNSSQSEINRIVQKFKMGFEEAIRNRIIAYPDNPMLRVQTPLSFQETKVRVPLSLNDEIKLLKFLATEDIIVKSNKCNYDNNTIRNLFIIALLTGCRIGELGSINYTKDINFEKKYIVIERTETENEKQKLIIGKNTKTGNHKKRKNKKDFHYVPFGIFDEEIISYILKKQIEITKSIKNNKNNLLFCDKNGKLIQHIAINSLFKRICSIIGIHYDNISESFSFHSTRHTVVTRLIEMNIDLKVIASIVGHSTTKQIEETYGHILDEFQMKQINSPGSYYSIEDLITPELKKLLLNIYEI